MPVPLRVLALSWGLIEIFAFLFTTGSAHTLSFALYAFLPPAVLILTAVLPQKVMMSAPINLALTILIAAALVRRVHSIGHELLTTPPYLLAAGLHAVSLVILALLIVHMAKIMRTRFSP